VEQLPHATYGVLLKRERNVRGWSQEDLADKLGNGASQNRVSRWESEKEFPGPHYRIKLSGLFGKSIEELGLLPLQKEVKSHGTVNDEQTAGNANGLKAGGVSLLIKEINESVEYQSKVNGTSGLQRTERPARLLSPLFREKKKQIPLLVIGVGIVLVAVVLTSLLGNMLNNSNISSTLTASAASSPTAASPSGTLHQEFQGCTLTDNNAGYLKIYTREDNQDKVACFSGIGSLGYSAKEVRKVETGNHRASWVYFEITGKQHRSPTSADESIYWCPGQERKYGILTSIIKITLGPPTVECVESNS
jgi:transcriptional regulator with XRE-family HTH domain